MLLHLIHDVFLVWIAASVADIATDNPNGNKTFLARDVKTIFNNGRTAIINGVGKLRNTPSWLVIFLVIPFIKFPLLFKDLITFTIFFILVFVRVISEPII